MKLLIWIKTEEFSILKKLVSGIVKMIGHVKVFLNIHLQSHKEIETFQVRFEISCTLWILNLPIQ